MSKNSSMSNSGGHSSRGVRTWLKLLLAALVALVFIGTFVFLWWQSRPQPVVYEEYTAEVKDIVKSTVVTGKIEPRDEVNVKPQISGIITDIYKEAGEMVQAGEVIAKVKVIPDMQQLSSAQARVRLANVNAAQAKVDYDREHELFEKGYVSADEYDKVAQAYRQAREEVTAANDQLQVVRDGVSRSNASASSTLIRSTISGLILDIPVKVGNSVILSNTFNDGTTIASVANMGDLIFRGNIDETEVGQLVQGMPMSITIGALEDVHMEARLEYISPKAVESNGANQFEIKAAIRLKELSSKNLKSGYSANAEIVLAEARNVLTIPEGAVEFMGDSAFVYVLKADAKSGTRQSDGGEVRVSGGEDDYVRVPVLTGLSDGISVEIKRGLSRGDRVRGPQVVKSE